MHLDGQNTQRPRRRNRDLDWGRVGGGLMIIVLIVVLCGLISVLGQ
jgi:hypothetical protein